MIEITDERKAINRRRTEKLRIKKGNAGRLDTRTLKSLYLLACDAPDLKSLYALRSCREAQALSRSHYSKFIILLDRLMESL